MKNTKKLGLRLGVDLSLVIIIGGITYGVYGGDSDLSVLFLSSIISLVGFVLLFACVYNYFTTPNN